MIFYSNAPKSDLSTHKKIVLEYDLSCIIWKDCFFSENMIFFLWTENERWSFPRETWKYDIFCIYAQMLQIWYYASAKKSEMIFSQKNSLKGDWHSRSHSRKSSNDSLYFYGHIHRSFHILLSSEKTPGNLIYRIGIWLLLQFI